jgi:deoxyribodipyrimidine photo-lyase
VYFNRDYTPFSVKRDLAIQAVCEAAGVPCHVFDDALLNPPGSVIKQSGGPYTVFTPFFNKASLIAVTKPQAFGKGRFWTRPIKGEDPQALDKVSVAANPSLAVKGGRGEAVALLKKLTAYKNYASQRDVLAEGGTTRLSAHLKFGTVSVREVFQAIQKALGADHPLIRQLYWRDFFTHIAYHFPHVFGGSFYEQYDRIAWSQDEAAFQAWCEGKTGFPIVDAGMRELNATGSMHNRARMITASFLVKDLHIDWRRGERYFAQKLVDYDPAVNNGNWQWAASTGCDHQPYFRIFNPWRQQERFDPDCRYIKRWVSELQALSAKAIHSLYKDGPCLGYPAMIVDHAIQAEEAKEMYRSKG